MASKISSVAGMSFRNRLPAVQDVRVGDPVVIRHDPIVGKRAIRGKEYPNCCHVVHNGRVIGDIPEPSNDPDTPQQWVVDTMRERGEIEMKGSVVGLTHKEIPPEMKEALNSGTVTQEEAYTIMNYRGTLLEPAMTEELWGEYRDRDAAIVGIKIRCGEGPVEPEEENGYVVTETERYRRHPENGKLYLSITSFLQTRRAQIFRPDEVAALEGWKRGLGPSAHKMMLKYTSLEGKALHEVLGHTLWVWGNMAPATRKRIRDRMAAGHGSSRIMKFLMEYDCKGISTEEMDEEAHIVWDDRLELCGTNDLYWWKDRKGGHLIVADHKRSSFANKQKKKKNTKDKELQISFYAVHLKRKLRAKSVTGIVFLWDLDDEGSNARMIPLKYSEDFMTERYNRIIAIREGEYMH